VKLSGISRKTDELGSIVIPTEIRNNLNIKEKDDFYIYIEENKIILEKAKKGVYIAIVKIILKLFLKYYFAKIV